MKKLIFTSLLSICLFLPASFPGETTTNTVSKTELSSKKPKKSKRIKSKKTRSSRSYSQSKGCSYNGHELYVGKRGGCYYMTGSSKQYVDKSYCLSCN